MGTEQPVAGYEDGGDCAGSVSRAGSVSPSPCGLPRLTALHTFSLAGAALAPYTYPDISPQRRVQHGFIRRNKKMRKSHYLAAAILASLACSCFSPAQEAPKPQAAPEIEAAGVPQAVLNVFPSVVRIFVVAEEPAGGRVEKLRGSGSGVIISPDGYVVTNHHVAGNTTHIVCNLSDHQEIPARLVGTDPLADIAVLKIDTNQLEHPDRPLPAASWGDSDAVQVGDPVFAMGSPAAISQSVTKGIVANDRMIMPKSDAEGMQLDGEDNGSVVRWLAHDATIFFGNSGGPLVNAAGEIIGINEIGFANLSGAIPGNLARSVVSSLIEHGEVPRTWSGITLQARLDEAPEGALVADVAHDSPAAGAGIEVGDILLSLGSVKTDCRIDEDVPVVTSQVMSLPAGAVVEARYIRSGKVHTASLTLEPREPAQHRAREERRLGCTFSDISRSVKHRLGLPHQSGVLVRGVRPGSPASASTPPLGDDDVIVAVNNEPIAGSSEFLVKLDELQGKLALLTVLRQNEELLLAVDLGDAPSRRAAARPKRAWIPIRTQVVTAELAEAIGLPNSGGVRVTQILPDAGPGFPLQVGDIVTALDGKTIKARRASDSGLFRRLVERCRVGDEVTIALLRNGEALEAAVTFGAPPLSPALQETYEETALEFTCRDRAAADGNGDAGPERGGVVVVDVARGGWADLGGLRKGDRIVKFNDTPMNSVEDLSRASEAVCTGQPDKIVIVTRFLCLEPIWK